MKKGGNNVTHTAPVRQGQYNVVYEQQGPPQQLGQPQSREPIPPRYHCLLCFANIHTIESLYDHMLARHRIPPNYVDKTVAKTLY
jgi:hypothetical protein